VGRDVTAGAWVLAALTTLGAGRTLLVTNFGSGQVELVNVAGLP
jgi:hypothetical protein